MNPQQQVRPAPLPQELLDAGWKLQSSPQGYYYTHRDGLTQWFRPCQPSGEPDISPERRDAGWCYCFYRQYSQAGPGGSSRTVAYLKNTKTQEKTWHLPWEATPSAPSASASATTPQVIDVEADLTAKLMEMINGKFVDDGETDVFEAVRAILIKELVPTTSEDGLNASRVLRGMHERGDGATKCECPNYLHGVIALLAALIRKRGTEATLEDVDETIVRLAKQIHTEIMSSQHKMSTWYKATGSDVQSIMRFALGDENGDKVDAALRLLHHVRQKGSVPSLEAFHWALALRPRPQVALMLLLWFEEIDAVDCVEIKISRRVRAESSRRPLRFLTARRSQHGRVSAPDAPVDFHTASDRSLASLSARCSSSILACAAVSCCIKFQSWYMPVWK